MVYKCIHGLGPSYLALHCEPTSSCPGPSHLWSTTSSQLNFPRMKTDYGKRSFAVNGPVVWNSLPTELWSHDISLDVFKATLKTFLFNCWLSTFGVFYSKKNGTELRVSDLHFSLCVSVCGSADMSGMADHHISGCILAGARLFCWVSKISSVFFFSCVCVIGQPGTASSSAECSRDKPPFSFVRGQDSTMCDIVWVSR